MAKFRERNMADYELVPGGKSQGIALAIRGVKIAGLLLIINIAYSLTTPRKIGKKLLQI